MNEWEREERKEKEFESLCEEMDGIKSTRDLDQINKKNRKEFEALKNPCRDCAYCKIWEKYPSTIWCAHPESGEGKGHHGAGAMRQNTAWIENPCGPEGKHFVSKDISELTREVEEK